VIKRFGEVQFEHKCGEFSMVAALYKFHGIDKILQDQPSFDKPSLVNVNDLWDLALQSCHQ
jgi:hypothetical protein